jgi:hypothetical protein
MAGVGAAGYALLVDRARSSPTPAPAPRAAIADEPTKPPPDAATTATTTPPADAQPRPTATLAVSTTPAGADVFLGDVRLGVTPLEKLELPATEQPQRVVLRLDGYRAITEQVELTPGAEVSIDRRLAQEEAARPRFGTIDLYVEPWANVYLGSKKVGVAPQQNLRLPVGKHRLRLRNPVQNRQTTITVTVPSARPYRITLPK